MKTLMTALIALALPCAAAAQDLPTVKLGLLKFGTVNWEAQTIVDHKIDEKHGFHLDVVPFASGDATDIAIQGGAIDVSTSTGCSCRASAATAPTSPSCRTRPRSAP